MTDIEKLIERLHQLTRDLGNCDTTEEAADALTRLVAPLPAEVADAEYGLRIYCGDVQCGCVYMRTARLLESLARENANLNALLDEARSTRDDSLQLAKDAFESLARENARLAALLTKSSEDNDAWIELLAERDRLAADNRRLDMGMDAANRLGQYEEGLRLGIEADRDRLAAENAELRVTSDIHGQDACKLEIDVSSLRTELAECKAQNRAMAETMSGLVDAKKGG